MASSSTAPRKIKKVEGKAPFRAPNALPRTPAPLPPWDSEETANRVPHHSVRPGPIPESLRDVANAAGLTFKPELPDVFAHAVNRQGRPHAKKMMHRSAVALVKKGVRFGTGGYDPEEEDKVEEKEKVLKLRPYTDQELRQAFNVFDLNGNDYVDAAELTHIFAQIGEMPSENEISAMIMLCDPRGDGTVNFDDFLNIFSNPSEALRASNIKGMKHLLPRKTVDFDIRDPLGLVLEEKIKLKECSLMVVEVRKGSQAQDAGVKNGWKVISLNGLPVLSEKDFENRLTKLEKGADPNNDDGGKMGKKGAGKGEEVVKVRKQVKYDYSIVFAGLPGVDDSSSEESWQEEVEEEEEDEDEDDEDA